MRYLILALLMFLPLTVQAGGFGLGADGGFVYGGKFTRSSDGIYLQDVSDDFWIGATTCGAAPFCFDVSAEVLTVSAVNVPAKDPALGLNSMTMHGNTGYPLAPSGTDVKIFAMDTGELYKMDSGETVPLLVPTETCETYSIASPVTGTGYLRGYLGATHWKVFRSGTCYSTGSGTVTIKIQGCSTGTSCTSLGFVSAGQTCSAAGDAITLDPARKYLDPASNRLTKVTPTVTGSVDELVIGLCFDQY